MPIYTVRKDISVEYTEKKSRFIGHIFYVQNTSEAEVKISEIKKNNPQAAHNVWAYNINKGTEQRYYDDGEPQGTAGMPVLNVIKSNGIYDVLCVVTRYFGGILLGAGGLVRAYTKVAAMAVEEAGKAEIILISDFHISCGYENFKTVTHFLEKYEAENIITDYSETVRITASIKDELYNRLEKELTSVLYKNIVMEKTAESLSRDTK